jgi:hypothetical protein
MQLFARKKRLFRTESGLLVNRCYWFQWVKRQLQWKTATDAASQRKIFVACLQPLFFGEDTTTSVHEKRGAETLRTNFRRQRTCPRGYATKPPRIVQGLPATVLLRSFAQQIITSEVAANAELPPLATQLCIILASRPPDRAPAAALTVY